MVMNVWLEHFFIYCYYLHSPTENGVGIFLNIVTRRQFVYEASSVSKVPTAIIKRKNFYVVVEVTDCNRGNMQQMVQQSFDRAI
jgi:hypothetical protein